MSNVPRKYLVFDIETAKILPARVDDLLAHRPLGITCAAALCQDKDTASVFFSKEDDGSPSAQMDKEAASAFVDFLSAKVKEGYTLLTFNGLGFDFDVLAEESDRLSECRGLARDHVDLMFQVFCAKGFPVGLEAAARAVGCSKSAGVDGAMAPQLWRDGKHKKVMEYVAQDCLVTLQIAAKSEQMREFRWITRRGTTASLGLHHGWLAVREAMALPIPDTDWMDNPLQRSKFTQWLG